MKRTTMRCVAAAWALSAAAGLAIGQAAPQANELAERERIAADASRPTGERLAALDRALELRRAALADAQSPSYPADVAGYTSSLLTRLAWDGQDSTAIYGVALSASRDATIARVTEALEACRRAEDILKNRVVEAERGRGDAANLRADRALLAGQLPLLRARCAAILGGLDADAALRAMKADEIIRSLGGIRIDDPALECRRQATLGAAHLMKGEGEQALMLFDQAAAGATSQAVRAEAEAGRALALLLEKGPDAARAAIDEAAKMPPFVLAGKPEPSAQLLAMDVRHRIERARAMKTPEGPARRTALDKAFQELQALIDRTDLGLDDVTRRGIALGKMATAASELTGDAADLPAGALFARAIWMSDKRGQQAAAIGLLREIAEGDPSRLKALGTLAPEALWQVAALSVIETTHADPIERQRRAMEYLKRVAKEHPSYPRATEAMEAAVSYAQRLRQMTEPDPTFRDLYEKTLNEAIAEFPGHRAQHLWRVERGRLLMSLGRVDEALASFDTVPPTSNRAPDAVYLSITGLSGWMESSQGADRRRYAERIIERMAPSVGVILEFMQNPPADPVRAQVIQEYGAFMGMAISKALLEVDRNEEALSAARDAVRFADGLEEKRPLIAGPSAAVQARALVRLGRSSEAAPLALTLAADFAPIAFPAIVEVVQGLSRDVDLALRSGDEGLAIEISRRDLAPVAGAAAVWAASEQIHLIDEMRTIHGESLARAGEGPEAVEIMEDLISRRGREMRLVLGLGEARLASGDAPGAFDAFKEAAERLEHEQDHGPAYWQAWSRMLEILARDGANDKREQVAREVARLRVLDADLGGDPYRSRLEAVAPKAP